MFSGAGYRLGTVVLLRCRGRSLAAVVASGLVVPVFGCGGDDQATTPKGAPPGMTRSQASMPAATTSTPKPAPVTRSCRVEQPQFGGRLTMRARGIACRSAKRVLGAWDAKCDLADVTLARCRADGYECVANGRLRQPGRPAGKTRTTCRRGARVADWRFTPGATSAPADAGVRDCPEVPSGGPGTNFALSARNLSCEEARRLASDVAADKLPREGSPTEVEAFACAYISAPSGARYFVVRCVKGSQAFRFSVSAGD